MDERIFGLKQNQLIATIIFTVAAVGIIVNVFVLVFIRRVDSVKNAFIKFNISQSYGDIIVLVVFAIHAAPMTFFNNTEIFHIEWLNRIFGQICGTAYVACIYTHLLIALNRFMAITFPIKSRNLFTSRNSNIMIFTVWVFCAAQGIVYTFPACSFYYSILEFGFIFAPTHCGIIIKFIYDFCQFILVIIIVAILDALTIFKIHKAFTSANITSSEQQRRTSREARLFLQALLQDSAFLIALVSYMVISTQMHTKWRIFFTTTFAWEMVHTFDGIITIVCNAELRAAIIHPFNSKRDAVIVKNDAISTKHPRTSRISPSN